MLPGFFSQNICAILHLLLNSNHAGLLAVSLTGQVHAELAFLTLPISPDGWLFHGLLLHFKSHLIREAFPDPNLISLSLPLPNFFLKVSLLIVYFTTCSIVSSCMRSGTLSVLFTAIIPAPGTMLGTHIIIEGLHKLMASAWGTLLIKIRSNS